jgi:hypothetical protein
MRIIRSLVALIAVFVALPSSIFAAPDWASTLKGQLVQQYGLTKTGWGDESRITDPGPVYVVSAEGISARTTFDSSMLVTTVEDGKAHGPKGGLAFFVKTQDTKQVKVGDRFYVTSIDVKDDAIFFRLVSVDTAEITYRGSTKQTRYRAVLRFPMPKEQLETAAVADVKKVVDPIFISEAQMKSAPVATVQLGQSPDQVESVLGKPSKVIDLGTKKIFVYKDMKIVFVDGKVSDVQ